jgi:hypothetical protein
MGVGFRMSDDWGVREVYAIFFIIIIIIIILPR